MPSKKAATRKKTARKSSARKTATSRKQMMRTCLWFDSQGEEAARFYTGIFKNSRIGSIVRYSKVGYEIHKQPPGSVMTVEFQLNDMKFMALNGGPLFKFNEAISIASRIPGARFGTVEVRPIVELPNLAKAAV